MSKKSKSKSKSKSDALADVGTQGKKAKSSKHGAPKLAFPEGVTHAPVVLDVAGLTLDDNDRRRLAHPLVGGLILFARNWANRAQLTRLCAEIKSIRPDVLICVDHEGGRVQRFRTDGFTHVPAMRSLGEMWMNDGEAGEGAGALAATDAATACGYVLASELRACGVDLTFTPVLDLDWGESGVIGDRAFHADPRVATVLAKSVMHGLLLAGMANCGKHFPGHGFVKADSHVAVPVDERSLDAILADDAKPYEWLSTSLTSVMPAHVIYPQVDEAPAGFSPRWLQEILRAQLGFTGAIFSDDLSMEGASVAGSHTQGAIAALNAGCDMVLLCNQSLHGGAAVDALLDGLSEALAAGDWVASPDSESRRLDLLPQTAPYTWDELVHHPVYQQALSRLPR
jgi:beta-N-acetylhexosaminidase